MLSNENIIKTLVNINLNDEEEEKIDDFVTVDKNEYANDVQQNLKCHESHNNSSSLSNSTFLLKHKLKPKRLDSFISKLKDFKKLLKKENTRTENNLLTLDNSHFLEFRGDDDSFFKQDYISDLDLHLNRSKSFDCHHHHNHRNSDLDSNSDSSTDGVDNFISLDLKWNFYEEKCKNFDFFLLIRHLIKYFLIKIFVYSKYRPS